MSSLVFGADGGGTKTHGLVTDQQGAVVARQTSGGSNPNVLGLDAAAKTLYELIVSCCREARCSPGDLRAIVLGLAGAGREETRKRLRERLFALAGRELPVVIETDARVALEGAFNGEPGVVVIAGTGSIVIGKTSTGEIVRAGGWGWILGDEGSGYWLGREALKSTTLWYDGRGGSELLSEMIAGKFGLNSRERIVAAVYGEEFTIADIAPIVLRAAGEGDTVALELLDRGARELTDQAQDIVRRLHQDENIPVALLGGVAEQPLYASILISKINERIVNARVQAPMHSPAHGAVLMALREVMKMT